MRRLQGIFILDHDARKLIYGPDQLAALARHVDFPHPPQDRSTVLENFDLLKEVDVIFSGWGSAMLDEKLLAAAPRLRAFFYGAGSVDYCLSNGVWARGITVTSAINANSIPVAEYALAAILFSLKHGWRLVRETRQQRQFVDRNTAPGCYGSTVGLVSLGCTARNLLKLLRPFELNIIAYDPFISPDQAREMGVKLVSLEDLFERADVVSVHTPLLSTTRGLIGGRHLSRMKHGATFINTARGEVILENEMIQVAGDRPDLQFVLDVTAPEPPLPDSPLHTLPNVMLTPHIAGSTGHECRRMGQYMVEELERYIAGEALLWQVFDNRSNPPPAQPAATSGVTVKVKRFPRSAVPAYHTSD